jgi:thioredoxin 1
MAGAVTVTDETFPLAVEAESGVTVVDFWAGWCGPCRALAPIVDNVAKQYSGRVKFAKLDIDDNPATAARFGVRSIPSLLFFKDGELVDRTIGLLPASIVSVKIEQLLRGSAPSPRAA